MAWLLNAERWAEAQRSQPDVAQELLKISLKLTSERMDAITKQVQRSDVRAHANHASRYMLLRC